MFRLTGLDDEVFQEYSEIIPLESHHGGTVHFIETNVTRQRDIRAVLERIITEPDRLLREVDARTDEDGTFYLRYDKQAALAGDVVPTRGEDAIQVRIRPEVHPAKRALAVAALTEWLQALGDPPAAVSG